MADGHQTLLIVCQVYPPDPAAVGQHVADLAEQMARHGWRVIVYAAAHGYEDPTQEYVARERRSGVDVCRLAFSSFGKNSLAWRLIGGGCSCCRLRFRACSIVALTVCLSARFPVCWRGRNPGSMSVRVFDWINRLTLPERTQAVAEAVLQTLAVGQKQVPSFCGRLALRPRLPCH